MSRRPLYYSLILEADVLSGSPLSSHIDQLFSTYISKGLMNIYTPDISIEEVKIRFINELTDQKNVYNTASLKLSELLKQAVNGIDIDEEKIYEHVDAELQKYRISNLPCEYSGISLEQLVHKSIHTIAPFEKQNVNGLRDTIVAETILQNIDQLLKNGPVLFICPDEILRQYLLSQTMEQESFILYDAIPDCESYIRLQMDGMEDAAAKDVSQKAVTYWYELLYTSEVLLKVKRQLEIPYEHSGETVYNATYHTAHPVFVERQKQTYIWSTSVIYQQMNVGYAVTVNQYEIQVRWWSEGGKTGVIDCSPIPHHVSKEIRTSAGQKTCPILV